MVQESWFFRHPGAFEFLIHQVKQKQGGGPVSVLSAGCATGEEPYSAAITLLDAGLTADQIAITAVDLSESSLKHAERGLYGQGAFRQRDIPFRHRYFSTNEQTFELDRKVRQLVTYEKQNLLALQLPDDLRFDVVFCRNMLIYLHEQAQRAVLENLVAVLKPDGVIIVSPAEEGLLRRFGFCAVGYPKSNGFTPQRAEEKQKAVEPVVAEPSAVREEQEHLLEKASRLADRGYLLAAEKLCREYLQVHEVSAQGHFILALVKHASGEDEQAHQLFSKAVELNPEHYEALVYLALLAERNGNAEQATLFRQRASRTLRG